MGEQPSPARLARLRLVRARQQAESRRKHKHLVHALRSRGYERTEDRESWVHRCGLERKRIDVRLLMLLWRMPDGDVEEVLDRTLEDVPAHLRVGLPAFELPDASTPVGLARAVTALRIALESMVGQA